MKWNEAIATACITELSGSQEVEVFGVHYDSRRVKYGDIFVAMRGGTTDGSRYIDGAISKGALAVVTDSRVTFTNLSRSCPELTLALATNGRRALAEISSMIYGQPQRRLLTSGVTGTNGKTTTTCILENLLASAGMQCILFGTIENHVASQKRESEHTTPESRDLISVFSEGIERGCSEAIIEISSHAISQERIWGLPLDVAIITNLSQDHLDYYGTMEAYTQAKEKIFAGIGAMAPRIAIINADDVAAERMIAAASHCQVLTYGILGGDWRAVDIMMRAGITEFRLQTPIGEMLLQSPLVGHINIYNLLAAACAAYVLGCTLEQIDKATMSLKHAPGRFEIVPGSQDKDFTVVVDYAHTEDAIRNLILIARSLEYVSDRHVITMFGCGGDRDPSKRPKMGRVAGSESDLVIVTTDNPRSEDPIVIIEAVIVGVASTDTAFVVEADRHAAICIALRAAKQGDIVLLAGRGHESNQIFSEYSIRFHDVEHAALLLKKLRGKVQ
jgi:UDP-N-acetylmuramoyl-L-alanyl-D-glutamate--2,6-diaminopimelate ligase